MHLWAAIVHLSSLFQVLGRKDRGRHQQVGSGMWVVVKIMVPVLGVQNKGDVDTDVDIDADS